MSEKYDLLTNFDIEELCKEFKIPLVGCIPKDKLRQMRYKSGGYVINLNDSTQNGSHWTSLYVKDDDCCYFDSFGVGPPLEVLRFCKGKKLIINKDQIQNLNHESCGYYAIAFLYYMSRAKSNNLKTNLFLFAKPFDIDKTSNNDIILQVYLKKMYQN